MQLNTVTAEFMKYVFNKYTQRHYWQFLRVKYTVLAENASVFVTGPVSNRDKWNHVSREFVLHVITGVN